MPQINVKWRFVRIRTSEGEQYYWELVGQDGIVQERVPVDFSASKRPPGAPPDEPQRPSKEA